MSWFNYSNKPYPLSNEWCFWNPVTSVRKSIKFGGDFSNFRPVQKVSLWNLYYLFDCTPFYLMAKIKNIVCQCWNYGREDCKKLLFKKYFEMFRSISIMVKLKAFLGNITFITSIESYAIHSKFINRSFKKHSVKIVKVPRSAFFEVYVSSINIRF